ncbi:hypothetical protein IT568_03185 [bacterium]|nr:hypothetical protein [bacterium]
MKFFRYRKPSLKTLLGLTRAKRQLKKVLEIYEFTEIINAPKNFERKLKRNSSELVRIFRNELRTNFNNNFLSVF